MTRTRASILAMLLAIAGVPVLSGCAALVVGGATTGAIVANDRRPPEVVLGDERVELTAGNRLGKVFGDRAHINITSFNYTLLLTGEVPDAKAKEEAEKVASEVERVKGVVNELQVAGVSSLAARGNDTYLTAREARRNGSATDLPQLDVGTLEITGPSTDSAAWDATTFDPTCVGTAWIELSGDPVLIARGALYDESLARRLRETEATPHSPA